MRKLIVFLRWGTLAIAALLAVAVIVSPSLAPDDPQGLVGRILHLFAHDVTTRRTSIFAGLGLVATAVIFFRVAYASPVVPSMNVTPTTGDTEE